MLKKSLVSLLGQKVGTTLNFNNLTDWFRQQAVDNMFIDAERVSLYYKPITTFIGIQNTQDPISQGNSNLGFFSIMTDRNSGGTSRAQGSIEIMIERKIFGHDSKGVVETLNDTASL